MLGSIRLSTLLTMPWRIVRSLLFVLAGTLAGFAAAAAMVRTWLRSHGDAGSDEVGLIAIFDGIELASHAEAFRRGLVVAWFGGAALDLRRATLAPHARLDVRCVFGGLAVTVPPHWRVEAETTAIAGGIEVQPPTTDDPDAPILKIRAICLAGGVSIDRRPAEG